MDSRSEWGRMPLDETMLGERVSVRRRIPGETGPTGGPAMTDVVGRVVSLTGDEAVVERRDGDLVTVRVRDVVAVRRVPGRPRRTRPAADFSAEELMRICTRGWPPVESEPLGDWLLRAADGFTGRANSAAVHGDPGLPVATALHRVEAFYRTRELPPKVQVVEGSRWDSAITDAGWEGIGGTHDHAIVQVIDLDASAGRKDPEIEVRTTADEDWLAMYNRAEGTDLRSARAVLEGVPTVGFVRLGDPPIAIGRVAVTGEWAGMSCVEVDPRRRREGIGRRSVEASLLWATQHGANKAYLQTMRHNVAALELYATYGFADHHAYRYLTPDSRWRRNQ